MFLLHPIYLILYSVTALLVTGVLKRMSAIAKDIADQSVYEDLMEHSRYLRYINVGVKRL
jgi:hypothetical protein